MATYAQFKHVELYKIGHGKNRVPNAPKSCIGEIFNGDVPDGAAASPVKNGSSRPRVVRDTPTRPRDTHSRLFGQARAANGSSAMAPMITDTIRSNIQFGELNGSAPHSPHSPHSPKSVASTPSRVLYTPPKRNPVTGDGVVLPPPRRRHPAACRGAEDPTLPRPTHRYVTTVWPPRPACYYVESTTKPRPGLARDPYTLLGLSTDDLDKSHPVIDPNSLSPRLVLDRHWPPFPAQHYLEPRPHTVPHHPLPQHAFVGMTSAFDSRPRPDYKYNPIPTLDGPIDPYVMASVDPPPTLFRYERDGPLPDVSLPPTTPGPGPSTLTGFPPIFHKHVPGYLFDINRQADDLRPKTYFVDYVRQREMEGNPITGDGYKSMNGQINMVTSISGNSSILHNKVPPGGYSSGLW